MSIFLEKHMMVVKKVARERGGPAKRQTTGWEEKSDIGKEYVNMYRALIAGSINE